MIKQVQIFYDRDHESLYRHVSIALRTIKNVVQLHFASNAMGLYVMIEYEIEDDEQ